MIAQSVSDFEHHPIAAAQALRETLALDRDAFAESALPLLKAGVGGPGGRYLTTLLVQSDLIIGKLCDASALTLAEAISMAKHVAQIEPLLDVRLADKLLRPGDAAVSRLDGAAAERALEVLDAISEGTRIVPILSHMVRHPNERLRSKAVLLIGRRVRSAKWSMQYVSEADVRVQANAVEALWGLEDGELREPLRGLLKSTNNRVAGNAAIALYRMHDTTVIEEIMALATHEAASFRATGAWVMGNTADPRFLPALAPLLIDPSPQVRTTAFRSILRTKRAKSDAVRAGGINMRVVNASMQPDGLCSLSAVVTNTKGKPREGIQPVCFIVWEGDRAADSFLVREQSGQEVRVIGFGIAEGSGIPDTALEKASLAIVECAKSKRSFDYWGVTKLTAAAEAMPWDAALLNKHQALDAVRFTMKNTQVVADAANGHASRFEHGILHAFTSLLASIKTISGQRHLILLAGAGFPEEFDVEPLIAAASKVRAVIHIVGLAPAQGANPLKEICRLSGGNYFHAASEDELGAAFDIACRAIVHHYDVVFRPRGAAGEIPAVRLEICTPGGHAEIDINPVGAAHGVYYPS